MAEKWKKWIAGYPVRKVLVRTVAAGLLTMLVTAAYVGINYGSQISQVYQERVAMRGQWCEEQWNTVPGSEELQSEKLQREGQEGEKDAEQDTAAGSIGWDRSRFGRSDSRRGFDNREDGFGRYGKSSSSAFGGRWRSNQYGRTGEWYGQAGSYGMEQGWKNILGFGTTDYVLFMAAGIIGIILCLLFQLTLIVYAVQLAWKTGMSPLVCGLLVLFSRIGGVICLWVYLGIRRRCRSCGKIQKKDAVYCSECGEALKVKCRECQEIQPAENKYCSKCGKDLQK